MIRKIIKIDRSKCDGCGLCADACDEGAIKIIEGKAYLIRDDYCDGLGNCLPVCPHDAISFEEREAAAFDENAVIANKQRAETTLACGCSSLTEQKIERKTPSRQTESDSGRNIESQLSQWPVQIKLVSENASYFDRSHLLIAADCTAYAYGNFHDRFIKNRTTLIGCPKLDEGSYIEKLASIIQNNDIKSVTVVRMEVPCCAGIVNQVKEALIKSGKMIPWQVATITRDGKIAED